MATDPPSPRPDALPPPLYEELRRMAARCFRGQGADHTLQPTALVHEAWLKLAHGRGGAFDDETHFRAVAALAMRQVLLNHAERHRAVKRGGGRRSRHAPDELLADRPRPVDELLDLAEALRALEDAAPRRAEIAQLRLLGGLTMPRIAARTGRSLTTIEDDWRSARAWLAARLEAGS